MKIRDFILLTLVLVVVNIAAAYVVCRWDLTGDKRYTLSPEVKQLIGGLEEPVQVDVLLTGDLNAGFTRLRQATLDLMEEFHNVNRNVKYAETETSQTNVKDLTPTVIHERQKDGKSVQTTIYPYARLTYKGRTTMVNLLENRRGLSGEENLNHSIENLEYAFAEALHSLMKSEVERIAFLEGHGELGEREVYDLSYALSRYFQVDRGVLGTQDGVLDAYKAVIVADPKTPFSDTDKYLLDQYIMRGGRVLWLLDGVQFSDEMLSDGGYTPIIPLDLHLTDMLFRYGVRVDPMLVQDLQCQMIPVEISAQGQRSGNYQPVPWTYAPLLLTSEVSPITRGVMQVSAMFASCLDLVGGDDGIRKEILLATSSASRLTSAPAKVDLMDGDVRQERFSSAFIPVAVSLEGRFSSIFAHRLCPEGVETTFPLRRECDGVTRQVVVASGSIARGEWQQGQPLPLGYDRYTNTQFGNRDFLVNAVLYLTDDAGLISLRQKSFTLRLLNDQRSHQLRGRVSWISIVLPLLLLALTGGVIFLVRRKRYKA